MKVGLIKVTSVCSQFMSQLSSLTHEPRVCASCQASLSKRALMGTVSESQPVWTSRLLQTHSGVERRELFFLVTRSSQGSLQHELSDSSHDSHSSMCNGSPKLNHWCVASSLSYSILFTLALTTSSALATTSVQSLLSITFPTSSTEELLG